MKNKYSLRFEQLAAEAVAVLATKRREHNEFMGAHDTLDGDLYLQWKIKVKNLIIQACGKDSIHFAEFKESERSFMGSTLMMIFSRNNAVFLAAKDDYDGGFLTSVRVLVEGELFDSELDQARHLLKAGYTAAAAVTTRVVLETAIRQLAQRNDIEIQKLEKMNADLVKASAYNTLQQKRITYLAGIGNSAAHGKDQEYTKEQVENMIQETEQLVAAFTN